MKTILVINMLLLTSMLRAEVLIGGEFFRVNNLQFGVYSTFSDGAGTCYPYQVRRELRSNDTVYLKLLFETGFPVNAMTCSRWDTLTQTIIDSDIHYVNVSTGIIKYNEIDQSIRDTVWNMFDSTFAVALGLKEMHSSEFLLSVTEHTLLVKGKQQYVEGIELVDMQGKILLKSNNGELDIAELKAGVYLLRILTASGGIGVIRWYRA